MNNTAYYLSGTMTAYQEQAAWPWDGTPAQLYYDLQRNSKLVWISMDGTLGTEMDFTSEEYISQCHTVDLPYVKQHCYLCPHRVPCLTMEEEDRRMLRDLDKVR